MVPSGGMPRPSWTVPRIGGSRACSSPASCSRTNSARRAWPEGNCGSPRTDAAPGGRRTDERPSRRCPGRAAMHRQLGRPQGHPPCARRRRRLAAGSRGFTSLVTTGPIPGMPHGFAAAWPAPTWPAGWSTTGAFAGRRWRRCTATRTSSSCPAFASRTAPCMRRPWRRDCRWSAGGRGISPTWPGTGRKGCSSSLATWPAAASALRSLAEDEELRTRLGAAGLRRAEAFPTWEQTAERFFAAAREATG